MARCGPARCPGRRGRTPYPLSCLGCQRARPRPPGAIQQRAALRSPRRAEQTAGSRTAARGLAPECGTGERERPGVWRQFHAEDITGAQDGASPRPSPRRLGAAEGARPCHGHDGDARQGVTPDMAAAEQTRPLVGRSKKGTSSAEPYSKRAAGRSLKALGVSPTQARAAPVKTEPIVVLSSAGGSLQASMPRRTRGHLHL